MKEALIISRQKKTAETNTDLCHACYPIDRAGDTIISLVIKGRFYLLNTPNFCCSKIPPFIEDLPKKLDISCRPNDKDCPLIRRSQKAA